MQFEVGTQYITASIPSFQEKDDYNAVSCWATDSTNVCNEFEVKASRPVKLEITDINISTITMATPIPYNLN